MLAAIEQEVRPLAEWRERHYLTQAELAKAVGVHPQTIWSWEHGVVRPAFRNLRKLAEVLGVEPSQIREGRRE